MAAVPMRKRGPAGIDLAVVVPGATKARRPPPMAEAEGDEMEPMPEELPAETAEEVNAAFDVAAEEFLNPEAPPEERKAALKRAIEACLDEGY